jgi:hypothetical protein
MCSPLTTCCPRGSRTPSADPSRGVPAPVGAVHWGDGVLIGSLFGVAAYNAAEGEDVEVSLGGVYELPVSPIS